MKKKVEIPNKTPVISIKFGISQKIYIFLGVCKYNYKIIKANET